MITQTVAEAQKLSQRAKDLTTQTMTEVKPSSVAWTFLTRAHDELMRAVTNFEVAAKNLDEESK